MVPDVKWEVENGAHEGSWTEVFGNCAEEIFSAYYTASYVNAVAKAGKREYSIPMTANCWLDKGGAPGTYPAGGPVSRMMEVWACCAPNIDIIAPDIYVQNFLEICDEYTRRIRLYLFRNVRRTAMRGRERCTVRTLSCTLLFSIWI